MSKILLDNLANISNQKNTYLTPNNIKNGVQIFDIIGTYNGGSSNGVKMFPNVTNMQADPVAQLDDLAIVYETKSCVILHDGHNNVDYEVPYFPTSNFNVDCLTIFKNGNTFYAFTYMGTSASIRMANQSGNREFRWNNATAPTKCYVYASTNGSAWTVAAEADNNAIYPDSSWYITENMCYTTLDIYYFPSTLIYVASDYSRENASNTFDGIYQYTTNNLYERAKTQFDVTSENIYNALAFGQNGPIDGTLQETANLTKDQVVTRAQLYSDLSTITISNMDNLDGAFSNNTDVAHLPRLI